MDSADWSSERKNTTKENFRRDSSTVTVHRYSKMVISIKGHMQTGSSRVGEVTVGTMALSTKVSSRTACEMAKAYGDRVEPKEMSTKGNTRTI